MQNLYTVLQFYMYSPIMTTLLLILIFQVFTQFYVECATVLVCKSCIA